MSYTESYYTILGINYDASTHEIKQAYKKAALRTHPDRALPERKAEAEANFKKVAEAYEILSEPSSRDRYNRFGTPHSPPPQQPFPRRNQTSSSSSPSATMSSSPNTYFGVSPDSKPFSFQWESSYDSARRAQQSQQQSQQRFGQSNNRRPFNSVDPFQLFNEMFAREFQTSTSPSARAGGGDGDDLLFDEDPFFANHRKMADSFGFGFGAGPGMGTGMGVGMGMGMGMGGGMRSGGSGAFHTTNRHQSPGFAGIGGGGLGFDSPFASQGANSTAATRRADPFANQFTSMMSDSAFTSSSSSSFSGGAGAGGMTQSESTSTRTINGRTETVIRRVDHQGVETVHTITPEGQKVHVNGIEQRDHPLLQASKAQQQQAHAAPLPAPPSPGEWTY